MERLLDFLCSYWFRQGVFFRTTASHFLIRYHEIRVNCFGNPSRTSHRLRCLRPRIHPTHFTTLHPPCCFGERAVRRFLILSPHVIFGLPLGLPRNDLARFGNRWSENKEQRSKGEGTARNKGYRTKSKGQRRLRGYKMFHFLDSLQNKDLICSDCLALA